MKPTSLTLLKNTQQSSKNINLRTFNRQLISRRIL